jgi:hypothetical protein
MLKMGKIPTCAKVTIAKVIVEHVEVARSGLAAGATNSSHDAPISNCLSISRSRHKKVLREKLSSWNWIYTRLKYIFKSGSSRRPSYLQQLGL